MIKCEREELSFEGKGVEIAAELAVIVRGVKKAIGAESDAEFANDLIMHSVKIGLMSEDELDKEYKKAVEGLKEKLLKTFMKDLL